jgi:acetyl esterase/lipase
MELSRIAPELRKPVRRLPVMPVESAWFRRLSRIALPLMRPVTFPGVVIEQAIPGVPGIRVHRPEQVRSRAVLLWIHGGGLVMGAAKQDDRICGGTAAELGIVVVAADYRLAPEFPFPTPLDDCHMAWTWLLRNAAMLGVDPGRVIVGGQSAGAGLAAALAQRLYDEDGVQPIAQWLFCPMLDDRTAARQELDEIGHRVWNNRHNRYGWAAYLGSGPDVKSLGHPNPASTMPAGQDPSRPDPALIEPSGEDPNRTDPSHEDPSADLNRTDPSWATTSAPPNRTGPTPANPSTQPNPTDHTRTEPGGEDPGHPDPIPTNPATGQPDPIPPNPADQPDPIPPDPAARHPSGAEPTQTDLDARHSSRREPTQADLDAKHSSRTGFEPSGGRRKERGREKADKKAGGEEAGLEEPPRYAVPSRRDDLAGLPPAWIGVGDVDLFHDEDLAYAERLRAAGVPATFHAVPGAPHGFEAWAPNTGISRDYVHAGRQWLSGFAD